MIKLKNMNQKKIITVTSLIIIVLGVIYLSNFKKNTTENSVSNNPITNIANPALSEVKDTPTNTMPAKDIGIANPASTFCIESGGTLELVETPEGQMGNCTLPNGTVCDEWALFRGECNLN